jgi:hypothetical protein
MKPPWVGDFGTVIKNSKLFSFRHDFEVFSREIFELVPAEPALRAVQKQNPFANSKNEFLKSLFLGYFLLV